MDICIIGPKDRKEIDIELVEKAKKYFEKVLYVPTQNIRIESIAGKSIPYYKDINLLKFDVILPRIFRTYSDMGHVLIKLFEKNKKYVPIKDKSIVFGYNEFLTPIYLSEMGIPTPHTFFAMSRTALERILPNLNYPALLKLPYEKKGSVIIDSENSAKGIIDTIEKLSQPILIQETFEKGVGLSILVIGDNTYAVRDKEKIYRLNKNDKEVIMDTARVIGANLCQINAIKTSEGLLIHNVGICPKLIEFGEKFDEDLVDYVLRYLKEVAEVHYEKNVITKLVKWVERGMPR